MVRLTARLLIVLLFAVGAAACDDETTPTRPTPTDPVTETFSGTLGQNDAKTFSFEASSSGAVRATLKEIGADNTLVVGLALGNWNSTQNSCSIVLANDEATGESAIQGTMSAAGALCVRVYDVGNISGAPVPFTVEVTHP